jgi:hypothetical protein
VLLEPTDCVVALTGEELLTVTGNGVEPVAFFRGTSEMIEPRNTAESPAMRARVFRFMGVLLGIGVSLEAK